MPSSFRTPKTLADWLQLDYFRREPGLRRLRTLLVVGAMVLCLLGGVGVPVERVGTELVDLVELSDDRILNYTEFFVPR